MAYNDSYDDFWDISKLVPKKKGTAKPFSSAPKAVDFVPDNEGSSHTSADNSQNKLNFEKFTASSERSAGEHSYVPEGSHLIRRVTVKPSIDKYDFYDTFRKAALIYFDYKCPRSEFVPFYSYKPQYTQMTTEQKRYYFYWRDELRQKRYRKTDYSYVYLYAYEILNLPDKIEPAEGLSLLCDVWCAYRGELPMLDTNFSVWVRDYCLLHALPCPHERLGGFIHNVLNSTPLKEFYISENELSGDAGSSMLAYISDYDWRAGKYAGGDTAATYRTHMEGAMSRVLSTLFKGGIADEGNVAKFCAPAFAGSLCTHSVKCNLEVEYYSVAFSPTVRKTVTSAVKYTENKLRALLGVKSRLAVKELSDSIRAVIDGYFEIEFMRKKRERERAEAPEYERLYDAPDSGKELSLADALRIERASWQTTARLVEGTEEYSDADTSLTEERGGAHASNTDAAPVLDASSSPLTDNAVSAKADTVPEKSGTNAESDEAGGDKYGLLPMHIEFISLALSGDTEGQAALSARYGTTATALADTVNEAFFDNFGDVVLEECDDGFFRVIEDYTEEIDKWLK